MYWPILTAGGDCATFFRMGSNLISGKKILVLMVICSVVHSLRADVVYLTDNREIIGKATKTDGKVKIITRSGKVVTVNLSDVLYIARGPVDYSTHPKKPTSLCRILYPNHPPPSLQPAPPKQTQKPEQPLQKNLSSQVSPPPLPLLKLTLFRQKIPRSSIRNQTYLH